MDVETANDARSSNCAVAIVSVEGARVDDVYHSLSEPEGEFGERQVRIHGIAPEHVRGALGWKTPASTIGNNLPGMHT